MAREERHAATLKVALKLVKALPEPVEVRGGANPARDLEAFQIGGERGAVADDAVQDMGALHDAADLALEAKMSELRPVLF